MVSRAQVEVYARFGGDEDGLVRAGTPDERAQIPSEVWRRLERLRDGLSRERVGVAAPEHAVRLREELEREVPDPVARAILTGLVDADIERIPRAG